MNDLTATKALQVIPLLTDLSKDLEKIDARIFAKCQGHPLPVNRVFKHFADHINDARKACDEAVKQLDNVVQLQPVLEHLDNLTIRKILSALRLDHLEQ